MSASIIEETFLLRALTDAVYCSVQGRAIASRVGFSRRAQWEIAIAIKELVTNAVSHAGGGKLTIRACPVHDSDAADVALTVEVEDYGPGIQDLDMAVVDGYSRGRFFNPDELDGRPHSLGAGLGSVHRMMDAVKVENKKEGGLLVNATKYLTEINERVVPAKTGQSGD